MARRRKTPMEAPQAAASQQQQSADQYGMALSRKRLEKEGFRDAPHQGVQETIDAWTATVRQQVRTINEDVPTGARITRAFLLLREEPHLAPQSVSTSRVIDFEAIITEQGVGPLILNHVFALGHRTALNLALTSKRTWVVLAASVNFFDFSAGRLQNLGPTGVMLCATPQFTLQEMMTTRLEDPYGFREPTAAMEPLTAWHSAAITREEDAINTLSAVRKRLGDGPTPKFLEDIFEPRILKAIRAIEDIEGIYRANQFVSRSPKEAFEPQMIYSATRLQLFLVKIFRQRENQRVLHFHGTPFFDRRVLAIVLRACPHVTMLGVYNCPLIHLGDLIPLLDLIYEINGERRLKNAPPITGFDFYPSFHRGLDGLEREKSTYGLTADSLDLDIVQRGVYAILLKGFLKARQMKLRLLFEPDQALREFLLRLPNPPLSVPTFFDGLSRYLQNGISLTQKRQALFDLTKPIRLGLERNLESYKWYREEMGQYLPFCSSCGYELLYELFPAGERRLSPELRVCAACTLQDLLDQQPHHMRDWKVGLLGKLMPEWNGMAFNAEAPTGSSTAPESDLMRLRTTETLRNEPPPIHVGANGELTTTHYVIQLLRDNKRPGDSLQNLPSLRALAEGLDERWADLFNHCNRADMYARARHRIHAEAAAKEKGKVSKLPRDYYGEVWRRDKHGEVQSFNYSAAVQLHLVLEAKGW